DVGPHDRVADPWRHAQPMGHQACHRWLERRHGRGGSRRLGARRAGLRRRRLDPCSVGAVWTVRAQAYARTPIHAARSGALARPAVEETAELLRSLGHHVAERDPKYGLLLPDIRRRYLAGVADDAAKLDHPERLERRSRRMAAWGRLLHGRALRRSVRRE